MDSAKKSFVKSFSLNPEDLWKFVSKAWVIDRLMGSFKNFPKRQEKARPPSRSLLEVRMEEKAVNRTNLFNSFNE